MRRVPSKLSRLPNSDRLTTTGVHEPFRTIGPDNEGNPTRVTVNSMFARTSAGEPRAMIRANALNGLLKHMCQTFVDMHLMLSADLTATNPRFLDYWLW